MSIRSVKAEAKPEGTPSPSQTLTVEAKPTESREEALARTALRPTVHAALTVKLYGNSGFGELSLNGLVADLSAQTKAASGGDLNRGEEMLTAQAHTLDAIFNDLARRAKNSQYMNCRRARACRAYRRPEKT